MTVAATKSCDAALSLHARGHAVIPVPLGQKSPRMKGWTNLRLDEDACFARFAHDPLNIGLLNGEPSKWLIDIDIDDDLAAELADSYLPPTGAIFGRESRPRTHRIYRVSAPVKTKKWGSKTGSIVELRSTGTQTLGPGSVHPSGDLVRWDNEGQPNEVDPDELVEAIQNLVNAVFNQLPKDRKSIRVAARSPTAVDDRESKCRQFIAEQCRCSVEGERGDDALFRVACETVRFDLDDTTAYRVLQDFNRERCTPPWSEDRLRYKLSEARRVAAHGHKLPDGALGATEASWQQPLQFPEVGPPPSFELDRLFTPDSAKIAQFTAAVSEALQVPLELPAALILPVTALAISGRAAVKVAPGWAEPPPIWTMTMLNSGERKSTAFNTVLAPLLNWERAEAMRMRPVIARAKELKRICTKRLESVRREAANSDNEQRESLEQAAQHLAQETEAMIVPCPPRLRTGEPTPEAVGDLLQRNDERLLLAAPEAGAFDTMMGRYQRGVPNFDIYLSGHAGDSISIDRKHGGSIHMSQPQLSVAMTVQPAAVRDLLTHTQARGRGLTARFILSCPAGRIGTRKVRPDPVPDNLSETWKNWLTYLLELPKPDQPILVRLSDEADRAMSDFQDFHEKRLGPGGDLADHADFGSKLPGLVARIALALFALGHWARDSRPPSSDDKIGIDDVNAAIAWGQWAIASRQHVLDAHAIDPKMHQARKCADWVLARDKPSFTRRDLFTARRCASVQQSSDLDDAINILTDLGWIRRSTQRAKTGRPAERYEINPYLHNLSACTNGSSAIC